jgi:hypothetical protein
MTGWLRLGVALRADSGAVSPTHLSPGAVSGPTVEPALMAELRAPSWLRITAGYALAVTPAVSSDRSVFDPTQATTCADAHYDLLTPACRLRLAGAARPTAAGRYSAVGHSASVNATVKF